MHFPPRLFTSQQCKSGCQGVNCCALARHVKHRHTSLVGRDTVMCHHPAGGLDPAHVDTARQVAWSSPVQRTPSDTSMVPAEGTVAPPSPKSKSHRAFPREAASPHPSHFAPLPLPPPSGLPVLPEVPQLEVSQVSVVDVRARLGEGLSEAPIMSSGGRTGVGEDAPSIRHFLCQNIPAALLCVRWVVKFF